MNDSRAKLNLDVIIDINETIANVEVEINQCLREFNSWISQNPNLITKDNPVYLDKRQHIKFLKLRLVELKETKKSYRHHQTPRFMVTRELDDIDQVQLSRNISDPSMSIERNLPSIRISNKVSKRMD